MTRSNIKMAFPIVPLICLLFVSGTGIQSNEDFFIDLTEKLNTYNTKYPVEKAFLMTDRFVYRPGEDLWFKGFVLPLGNMQQSLSEDFFIKLFDSNGEEIIFRRYPISEDQLSGRLSIPRSAIPGRYWLVAYTGWMKNRCPEEAFRKEILISKYYEKRFQVSILYDKLVYGANDTLNAVVTFFDATGRLITETDFEYSVETFNKTVMKGSSKSDINGKSKISCIIPETNEVILLTVEIRNRKLSGDYSFIIPTIIPSPIITFHPEGGTLVTGITSNVAVKVINNLGLPEIVAGEIIDKNGRQIQTVITGSAGIGMFEYTPSEDTCFFRVTRPRGHSDTYPLPMAMKNGIVMRLMESGKDSVRIKLISSDHQLKTLYGVGVMHKQIIWTRVLKFTDSTLITIPVARLNTGILQISVFDHASSLLAERLVYVDNVTRITAKTDHQVYHNRQRVNVLIESLVNEGNINLALSVSLKNLSEDARSVDWHPAINLGFCEAITSEATHIDMTNNLTLLTTPYRDVYWQYVLSDIPEKKPYIKLDGLNGTVYDKKENLSQHAKVRITNIPNYRFYETQTNEEGNFQIQFGSDIIDYKYLNIDAYDALGKTSLDVVLDNSYTEELSNTLVGSGTDIMKQQAEDVRRYGEPDLVYVLRYGPGKFRKSKPDSRKRYDPNQYAKYTDVMDIIQDIKPYKLINNKIIFTEFDETNVDTTGPKEAIIVINGALKGNDISALKKLIPSDITNVNISTSLLDVHKYTPLNFKGVIEIATIQGMYRYRQSHMQMGSSLLLADREFYSPDYSIESSTSVDNRKTLFWYPKLVLTSGSSLLIRFYTSDIKGVFTGHIVGIDAWGEPVECDFTFRVE